MNFRLIFLATAMAEGSPVLDILKDYSKQVPPHDGNVAEICFGLH